MLGYRLVSSPDALHADDLWARLGKMKVVGRDIRVFAQTTSTNDVVEKLARDGVPEGVVVFAEAQTRGVDGSVAPGPLRRAKDCGFRFCSGPSCVHRKPRSSRWRRPRRSGAPFIRRPAWAPEIKWPNDILICGKKVVGILTELSAEVDRVKHVTLGVGVNVNQTTSELPVELRKIATSLRIEAGSTVSRPDLAVTLLRELDRDYARVGAGKFAEVADEWEAHCTTLGQRVTIVMGERRLHGRAEALDDDGALLLRTEHGRLERIIGGDVSLAK